ncbi:MAG TPA: hypothetical protein VGB38_00460 [bacterium]
MAEHVPSTAYHAAEPAYAHRSYTNRYRSRFFRRGKAFRRPESRVFSGFLRVEHIGGNVIALIKEMGFKDCVYTSTEMLFSLIRR